MSVNLLVDIKECIVRGALKGLEGELCKSVPEKSMVAIRIDGLGYACVSVSVGDFEVVYINWYSIKDNNLNGAI